MRRPPFTGSFWPDLDEEVLLRTVLARDDVAVLWRTVRGRIDFDSPSQPDVHRLVPMLWRTLVEAEIEDPWLPRFKGIYRKTWYRNHLLMNSLSRILMELATLDVDPIVLKGAALGLAYYDDLGSRPIGDIDLLCRRAHLPALERLASQAGWTSREGAFELGESWRSSAAFDTADGWILDVHLDFRREFRDPTAGAVPAVAGWWERAEKLSVDGVPCLVLGPTDQLLHVILHGAQWSSDARLRWVCDAFAVVGHRPVDWALLAQTSEESGRARLVHDCLCYLSALGAPVPAEAVERLSRAASKERGLAGRAHGCSFPIALGAAPYEVAAYLELSAGWSPGERVHRLPEYLRSVWAVPASRGVGGHLADRIGTKLRFGRC
jgi:hypothetical protein